MIKNTLLSHHSYDANQTSLSSTDQSTKSAPCLLNNCLNQGQLKPVETDLEINSRIEKSRKRSLGCSLEQSFSQMNISFESACSDQLPHKLAKQDPLIKKQDQGGIVQKVRLKNILLQPAPRPASNPLYNLTLNLFRTYNKINQNYLEQLTSENQIVVNPIVLNVMKSHIFHLNDGEIRFEGLIGKGSFGEVHIGCYHRYGSNSFIRVAIKINQLVNGKPYCLDKTRREASILKLLKQYDEPNINLIARILDEGFVGEGTYGIVQELYGLPLDQAINRTQSQGFSFRVVSKIGVQITKALWLLKNPNINLVHTDIKPDNILLEHSLKTKIRLIDLGNAKKPVDRHIPNLYIGSRFYRPPEAIFKMPFDQSYDIWSVGCVMFELHVGQPLFPADDVDELIQMIIELIGLPSENFVKKIPNWQRYFTPSETDPSVYNYIIKKTKDPMKEHRRQYFDRSLSLENTTRFYKVPNEGRYHTKEIYDLFKHLIRSMITWDSDERITIQDLYNHPFFKKVACIIVELDNQQSEKNTTVVTSKASNDLRDQVAV